MARGTGWGGPEGAGCRTRGTWPGGLTPGSRLRQPGAKWGHHPGTPQEAEGACSMPFSASVSPAVDWGWGVGTDCCLVFHLVCHVWTPNRAAQRPGAQTDQTGGRGGRDRRPGEPGRALDAGRASGAPHETLKDPQTSVGTKTADSAVPPTSAVPVSLPAEPPSPPGLAPAPQAIWPPRQPGKATATGTGSWGTGPRHRRHGCHESRARGVPTPSPSASAPRMATLRLQPAKKKKAGSSDMRLKIPPGWCGCIQRG